VLFIFKCIKVYLLSFRPFLSQGKYCLYIKLERYQKTLRFLFEMAADQPNTYDEIQIVALRINLLAILLNPAQMEATKSRCLLNMED
jgi:hypothetical protein